MNNIFLSYHLDSNTPIYGGSKGICIDIDRSIENGDSANTKIIKFNNHSGTHIDYPNHFIKNGSTSNFFDANFWQFNKVFLIKVVAKKNEIINLTRDFLTNIPKDIDFLIIKTGFGKLRETEDYWKYNPGISPETGFLLKEMFPNLKIIGFDFISLTSFQNRELGRIAHKTFLGGEKPILIIEDMDLSKIEDSPKSLICLPIMLSEVDGAPVTIIATL